MTHSLSLHSPVVDRSDSGLMNRAMGNMNGSDKASNKAKQDVKGVCSLSLASHHIIISTLISLSRTCMQI
jgi:hypothetical protein